MPHYQKKLYKFWSANLPTKPATMSCVPLAWSIHVPGTTTAKLVVGNWDHEQPSGGTRFYVFPTTVDPHWYKQSLTKLTIHSRHMADPVAEPLLLWTNGSTGNQCCSQNLSLIQNSPLPMVASSLFGESGTRDPQSATNSSST